MLVKDHYSIDKQKNHNWYFPTDLISISSHQYPKTLMVFVGDQEYIGHQLTGIKYWTLNSNVIYTKLI